MTKLLTESALLLFPHREFLVGNRMTSVTVTMATFLFLDPYLSQGPIECLAGKCRALPGNSRRAI